jgi:RNA polymerase sigma factor (sigma-70 family)
LKEAIDKELIKSCLAQDRSAQKKVYTLLLPYLRTVAMRYLRDVSYIKDVLQESFVKVFVHLEQFDQEKAPLRNWAARITINSCLNYNKRIIGIPMETFEPDFHDAGTEPEVLKTLSNEDLLNHLKGMPEGYFEVFNLNIIDGFKHDEIAKMLGISADLSRQRLSRARLWLKQNIIKVNKSEIETKEF